ncbi:MAG: hypothetical protein MZV64_35545 [Ignavibacteriales bacterium]|nr:hypothetical protein [Ignavibacteriales bacterium]
MLRVANAVFPDDLVFITGERLLHVDHTHINGESVFTVLESQDLLDAAAGACRQGEYYFKFKIICEHRGAVPKPGRQNTDPVYSALCRPPLKRAD